MDYFNRLKRSIVVVNGILISLGIVIPLSVLVLLDTFTSASPLISYLTAAILGLILAGVIAAIGTNYSLSPLKYMWQSILHIAPGAGSPPAPNESSIKVGHELVSQLTSIVFQFASQQDQPDLIAHRRQLSQAANIVNNLPMPLFVFNKRQIVTSASQESLRYCQLESSELFGKPLYENLNLEFKTEETLEKWIEQCQGAKITDISHWDRVRITLPDGTTHRQCDMVASYSKDNPSGTEFIVMLFDRSDTYEEDDKALNFISLAVHELRTPLTMLRGYIEVLQREASPKLDSELQSFIQLMNVSANQLTAFVNNILNVGRIQENELVLKLHEGNWNEILTQAVETMQLRATTNNKALVLNIDDNLPSVAVDHVSATEVITNLIDNAIKYSGKDDKQIIINATLKDDMVVTTVQDFGTGIASSVVPNLFERSYRNHRTKGDIGGTGLGLYLSKALVSAHGGNIWVDSKEGKGSTFGFSLVPYDKLADEKKNGNNEITRNAHGWIKNHSLYRR